jgi:thioredoxin-like negative regulator of GroEL
MWDAALVAHFGVQDLPAYVLVDAQGNLRRRFAGSRPETVFRAMLEEVSQTGVAPATAGQ